MTTLSKVCKSIVMKAVDDEYVADNGCELSTVYFHEYGNFNGTSPKACMGYLQGLPSVCTVPFYNGEILELLAAQGISRKSEAAQAKLIDDYWYACGNAFYNMVK